MLIVKNKNRINFLPTDGRKPGCVLTHMYKNDLNKIVYVYNVTIPVKTQEIVNFNIRKINIVINADVFRNELTDFESLAFNGSSAIVGKPKGRVTQERKIKATTMDALTTTSPGKDSLSFGVVNVIAKEGTLGSANSIINQALKTFGGDAAKRRQVKPKNNFPSTPITVDAGLDDDDNQGAFSFYSVSLDRVYADFAKIKNSKATLSTVYDTKNRKLSGQKFQRKEEKKKKEKSRNTMNGAQTPLQPFVTMMLKCGNNITLDKISDVIDNNSISNTATYSGAALVGIFGASVAPTSLVRGKIGEIITCESLYAGTSPLPLFTKPVSGPLFNNESSTDGSH